jgi:hypothetical protein
MNDWVNLPVSWLPFLLLLGVWLYFSRYHGMQARGSSTGATLIFTSSRWMNANLERIPKPKAEKYCAEMIKWIATHREEGDPLCISEDTIQFGARSTLLTTLGVREKLRPIVTAKVRNYSSRIARRYDVRDNWYAPVAYLRSLPDESIVGFHSSIFLITEPLFLDRYLANWRECGLQLQSYDVPIILSDDEFDQFARSKFDDGFDFLIDPLFSLNGELSLISGAQLVPLDSIASR